MPNQFNADDLNPDAAPVEPEANQPQPDQQADLQDQSASESPEPFTSVNPNELPPELQQRYKQMEADYTRKTQAAAKMRKEAEGLQEDATAWRLFQRHPELRQAFNQNVSQTQTQAGASGLVNGEEPDEDAPFIEKLEPDAFRGVRGIVKKELVEIKRELEAVRAYKGHIDYMIQDNVRQRWEALQREYPGAGRYQAQIASFLAANPAIQDLKQAFFAVAGEAALKEAKHTVRTQDTASRQQAQLVRGQTPPKGTTPQPQKRKLADIFKELMQKQQG